MSATQYWVRLGGWLPLTEVAAHSAPTWETWADGGDGPASWAMSTSAKFAPHMLRPGTLAEIMLGLMPVWRGRIGDYDRITGEVTCRGLHTDALRIPALDGSGNATRVFTTALSTAVAAPWRWRVSNPNNVTGTPAGDSADPMMVAALLDALAQENGSRWGLEASGVLYMRPDPTFPSWLISPDAAAFGTTDEDVATHLVGRYDTGSGYDTVVVGDTSAPSPSAELVDLTPRGTLTAFEAEAVLNGILSLRGSRTGWINGVTLNREQVTNMGGEAAPLGAIRAGWMARAHGVAAMNFGTTALSTDAVIGKTRYTAGDSMIYLEPVNTAPRTLSDVIAAA